MHKISLPLYLFFNLLFAVMSGALAQETGSATAGSSTLEELNKIEKTIEFLQRRVQATTDDDGLINVREKLREMRPFVAEKMAPLRERLDVINARLGELGAAPTDGSTEDLAITEERTALARERVALQGVVAKRDEVINTVNAELEKIADLRRNAFRTRLTERSPISRQMFDNLDADMATATSKIGETLSRWATSTVMQKPLFVALALLVGGAVALMFRKLTRGAANLAVPDAHLTRFGRLSRAFVSTVVPTLMMALLLASFFGVLYLTGLYPLSVRQLVTPLLAAFIGIYFVSRLAQNIFAPNSEDRRILNISDYAAGRFKWIVIALAVVQALDYVAQSTAQIISAPLSLTIANSFIAAILVGLLLVGSLFVRQDHGVKHSAMPRWLRAIVLVAALTIIGVAAAGYIGLSRFFAQQVVITGAIIATTYLGLLAARELGKPESFAKTTLGEWVAEHRGTEAQTLDQYGLVASMLFSTLVFIVGIPAILLQWGTRTADLWSWVKQLFFGIEIGSITFSLADILFGIAVFFIVVLITRLVQRWLSNSVLSRTKADAGVRHSIRTGVGYAGFALAALLGVTSAGFNLASLAIVAGALSLGIGFGLQNVVSNFVSGLILLVERPIKVGDFVETGDTRGYVRKVSVRATEVETVNNLSIILPNSDLINNPVSNWTHQRKAGRLDLPVGVSYSSDLTVVREALLRAVRDHPEVSKSPEPWVFFSGFGDNSVDFQLRVNLRDFTKFARVQTDLYFNIFEELAAVNVEIPFPQRDLHLRSVDDDVAKALSGQKTTRKTKTS